LKLSIAELNCPNSFIQAAAHAARPPRIPRFTQMTEDRTPPAPEPCMCSAILKRGFEMALAAGAQSSAPTCLVHTTEPSNKRGETNRSDGVKELSLQARVKAKTIVKIWQHPAFNQY